MDIATINERAKNEPIQFVGECEGNFKNHVSKIAQKVYQDKIRFLFVCGPSSSGKTTFSSIFHNILENTYGLKVVTVSLDDFFLDLISTPKSKNGGMDFETVKAVDIELFRTKAKQMVAGGCVKLPLFDFKQKGRVSDYYTYNIDEKTIVIVEGIHSLNPKIYRCFGNENILKLFIKPTSELTHHSGSKVNVNLYRMIRRILRDNSHRNCPPSEALDMWNMVRYGEKRYEHIYAKHADIKLDTYLYYEGCIFKNFGINLLKSVPKENVHYTRAVRLVNFLNQFEEIDYTLVPNDSILKEFLP